MPMKLCLAACASLDLWGVKTRLSVYGGLVCTESESVRENKVDSHTGDKVNLKQVTPISLDINPNWQLQR